MKRPSDASQWKPSSGMAGSTGGGASKRVLRRGLATGGRLVAICLRRRNTCENAKIYSHEGHNRTGVFRPEFTYGSQGAPDVLCPVHRQSRNHPRQRPENRGPRLCLIEARFPVAAHARGHNLEFGAPGQSRLVQGVGTTSSGRALRRTAVPRRSYSTSSSYSSSSSSMLMACRSPIDQRATIRMMLHPTYQSPS